MGCRFGLPVWLSQILDVNDEDRSSILPESSSSPTGRKPADANMSRAAAVAGCTTMAAPVTVLISSDTLLQKRSIAAGAADGRMATSTRVVVALLVDLSLPVSQ